MDTHPVAALFPMIDGTEFDQLVEDVRAHGLRDPIKTWNGVLLDGRNRLRACEAAGVTPRFQGLDFASEHDAIAYIVSVNVHRRHLNVGQRAMIGEALRPKLAEAAKQRMVAGGEEAGRGRPKQGFPKSGNPMDPAPVHVDRQIASMMNVGHDAVAQAHKVAAEAPELADKVRSGEMKLNAAYKQTKAASSNKRARKPRNPSTTPAKGQALAQAVIDEGKTLEQAAAEFAGGSIQIAKIEVAKEIGRREVKVDPDTLPMSAQEKLQAAIRQEKARLAAEFERTVQAEIKRLIDETVLPAYHEELAQARQVIESRKGVMARKEYLLIASCLHPDQSASKERLNEAFVAFTKHELALCSEKEMPTAASAIPRTYDEMMRRKAEVKERRRQQSTGGVPQQR